MTRSYSIRLGAADTGSANFIQEVSDYENIEINTNPSSFGDWQATIPYDTSIEQYILERVYIVDDVEGDVLFTGVLETVSSTGTGSVETTISGRGVLIEEDYEARSYRVSNAFLKDEIKNFASNYIRFDTTFLSAVENTNEPFQESGDALIDDITNNNAANPTVQGSESLYIADVGLVTDFTQSMYDAATKTGTTNTIGGTYSQGSAVELGGSSGTHSIEFDIGAFEYDVPEFKMPLRYEASGVDELRIYVNGTEETSDTSPLSSDGWRDYYSPNSLTAGTTNTVRIEVDTSDTSTAVLDAFSLHDDRFTYNLPSTLNDNDVYSGPEQTPLSYLILFEEYGTQTSNKASATFEVDAHPNDGRELTEFEAQFTGSKLSGGNETVTDTYTSDTDTRFVPFDVTFDEESTGVRVDFNAKLQSGYESEVSGNTGRTNLPALFYATIVPFDSSKMTFINEKEYSGTDAEIYKKLHEDSIYSFAVDYGPEGATAIDTFPKSKSSGFGGVRVNDYSREIDYSEYANQVTVRGRDGSGNVITGTAKNSDEINRIGRTIHRTFTEPSLSTQNEVQFAASNKLRERVLKAQQSGDIKAVPSRVKPGYAYGWTPFNDKFTGGGTIGEAGLIIDGDNEDWLKSDTYVTAKNPSSRVVFDFLIWPHLAELGDEEYYTVFGTTYGRDGDFVRVYGDGSLEVCQPTDGGAAGFTRTEPGLLIDRDVTRVTIDMNAASGEGGIYVGKGTAGSPDESLPYTDSPSLGNITISKTEPTSSDSISTTPDVWYRFGSLDTSGSYLRYGDDVADTITLFDIRDNHDATVSNPSSSTVYVSYNGNATSGSGFTIDSGGSINPDSGHTTTFAIGTSDFSMAAWIEDVSPSTLTERYIFDKNRDLTPGEGHALYIEPDTGYLVYEVSNGSSTQTLKGNTNLYNDAHHVGVTIEQGGSVKLWVDGEIEDSATYAFSGEDVSTSNSIYIGNVPEENRGLNATLSDFVWFNSLVSDSEMQTLAEHNPFANAYSGGIDDLRVWDDIGDISVLLENPYADYDNTIFDEIIANYAQTRFTFDSYDTTQDAQDNFGIDFGDDAGYGPITVLYNRGGTLYEPERGTLEEVSISIGRGSASMTLNLNLSRRVDANLSKAIEEIDDVKKLL